MAVRNAEQITTSSSSCSREDPKRNSKAILDNLSKEELLVRSGHKRSGGDRSELGGGAYHRSRGAGPRSGVRLESESPQGPRSKFSRMRVSPPVLHHIQGSLALTAALPDSDRCHLLPG